MVFDRRSFNVRRKSTAPDPPRKANFRKRDKTHPSGKEIKVSIYFLKTMRLSRFKKGPTFVDAVVVSVSKGVPADLVAELWIFCE